MRRAQEIQDEMDELREDSHQWKVGGIDGTARALKLVARRLDYCEEPQAREAVADACTRLLEELEERQRELGRWLRQRGTPEPSAH